MAREKSDEKKRLETLKNLKKIVAGNGLNEQIYLDKIDEYMSFYDDLKRLNDYIKTMDNAENLVIKNYTDAVGEKRRVTSEMRNILTFLGLKPDEKGGPVPEKL